jgi:glycerate kinase
MKILVAMDSFKGSLSAQEACDAVENGIKDIDEDIEVIKKPIADGGEGTVNTLVSSQDGEIVNLIVSDPLFRKTEGYYGIIKKNTAIMEMAISSGLTLLKNIDRNPLFTTTFGLGEMIKHALDKGIKSFVIGIGGSATNDAGIGMLDALGMKFYDKEKNLLKPIGKSLGNIYTIVYQNFDERIKDCNFLIACDVNNPLFGKNGAAYIYGPQKGASKSEVIELDLGLMNFSELVKKYFKIDKSLEAGAGAAGGLGYAFSSFMQASLKPGIEIVMETLDLEKIIPQVDLIITGEGKIDEQSKMGKVLSGIGNLAKKYKKPAIAFAGIKEKNIDLKVQGIQSIYQITPIGYDISKAMKKNNATNFLKECVKENIKIGPYL